MPENDDFRRIAAAERIPLKVLYDEVLKSIED